MYLATTKVLNVTVQVKKQVALYLSIIATIFFHQLKYFIECTVDLMQVASSTSITIVRIIYFTIVLCVYVIVLDLFYLTRIFTELTCFYSTFKQRIAIHM